MKYSTLLFLIFLTLSCNGQIEKKKEHFLTVSPIINKEDATNALLISTLKSFLQSKNNSISENNLWSKTDFQKYTFPYSDIYNIEQSKHGNDFYKPTLMEILSTENKDQKILKIAFIGHNPETGENLLKAVYNIIASTENNKVTFSRYLDYATSNWTSVESSKVNYIISPHKSVNHIEIVEQQNDINKICDFFNTQPINITYYSCISPKELFEIKGFDYNIMMYADKSGGLAELGNLIFSGNNSDIYTHEIVHIYTKNLYPKINKFLDEGISTYIAGSGKFDYEWHRSKFAKFLLQNPNYDFNNHLDPYERLYFEEETSIPYLTSALICERTNRIYGKQKLLEMLKSEDQLWQILQNVGLNMENINAELRKELAFSLKRIW